MTAAWDDLVSTALLGTERRPFAVDGLSPVVDPAALRGVEGAEAAVLAGAALLGAYRRAGRRPDAFAAGRDLPVPAPDDGRPVCSDTAAQLLALILDGTIKMGGGNEDVIATWLAACARAGQRPPARLLVTLLELGTARAGLRPAIVPAIGARGAWLAAANPDWAWAAALAPARATTSAGLRGPNAVAVQWATGTRVERLALLRLLRATHRDAARALLESTWAAEPAAERVAFLEAMADGCNDDDEPFLEQALDDRAASVRTVAVALLHGLPGSRWAQRMAERALPLVQREGRFRPALAVRLPDELDAAARRDGITDTRDAGKGLRAGWLQQIVAATPLDVWEDHLGADPAEAVKLARIEHEVLAGWEQAAVRQHNARWAAALLTSTVKPGLLAVLAPADQAVRLEAVLRDRHAADATVVEALSAVPGPWSPALSVRAIERARDLAPVPASVAIHHLAAGAHPGALPAIEDWIARSSSEGLKRQLRQLAHRLSIRQSIDREFP